MKVDVMLSGSLARSAERAREMEATGVDGLFTFENAHDVFFPLVVAAPATSLDLMTNVAIAFPRSPMHLANAAYDLQALSRGHFSLGLGTQVRAHVERRYGSQWDKPVAKMREWVQAIKAILEHWQSGAPLRFEGDYTRHTLMTPAFNPGPNKYGMPKVLVGALGPRMNEMAAEVADGILVMPFNTARHMEQRTLPAIERGLATAGRTADDIEITVEVITAVGRNDEELEKARAARFLVAFYGSTPAYKGVLDAHGWGDVQPELNAMSKRGAWTDMGSLITDEMFETLAVVGNPDEVGAEIHRRFGTCADRAAVYFPGYEAADDLVADVVAAIKGGPS